MRSVEAFGNMEAPEITPDAALDCASCEGPSSDCWLRAVVSTENHCDFDLCAKRTASPASP